MKIKNHKFDDAPSLTAWEQLTVAQALASSQTDQTKGLTTEQVTQRLEFHGLNQLPEKKRFSALQLFVNQFSSIMVIVLMVAVVISGFLGEWFDAATISVIIVLNAIIGFIQEYSAEQSLAALKKLTKPMARVVRDGVVQSVAAQHLVPGDLVLLEAGDAIPADGRIIHLTQLIVQEATLTGESESITKTTNPLTKATSISAKKNMVFMGTCVVSGKGTFVVTHTGLTTELGRIASLLEKETEHATPLQIQLEVLGRHLLLLCLGIVGIIFAIGILRGYGIVEMFISSISLAVAAIPEGLPAVVTVTLAIGVRRMARRNALMRRLPAVETLGCTTVICTDKTGTLTQNQMTVRKIFANNQLFDVSGTGYAPKGTFMQGQTAVNPQNIPELFRTLQLGLLCNDATVSLDKTGQWIITGDPTEAALVSAAGKAGLERQTEQIKCPVLGEIPFDSERKRMSVVRSVGSNAIVMTKGSPNVILERCSQIAFDGHEHTFDKARKEQIATVIEQLASQALRVLAVAYRTIQSNPTINNDLEHNLVFVGLFAMIDPPRPEVKAAIATCKRAGIRSIMITGDHAATARAIAVELGLMNDTDNIVTGPELDTISDGDLKHNIGNTAVYAQTSASHKIRIVKLLQECGEIVAMTGDGVNDAPAVKAADIGVAMGITGTDVTKESADMVIVDDNFASIVNAIEEGRGIYDNIIKFVNYLLSSNMAELLIIFFGVSLGLKDNQGNTFIPLLPIHLLWLNLVTDGLPAIALGMDPLSKQAMDKPPRQTSQQILGGPLLLQLGLLSIIIAVTVLTLGILTLRTSGILAAYSVSLTALVLLELVRAHAIRSHFHMTFFSNPWFLLAVGSSLMLQLMIVYVPSLQSLFQTTALGTAEWVLICAGIVGAWFVSEIVQRLFKKDA